MTEPIRATPALPVLESIAGDAVAAAAPTDGAGPAPTAGANGGPSSPGGSAIGALFQALLASHLRSSDGTPPASAPAVPADEDRAPTDPSRDAVGVTAVAVPPNGQALPLLAGAAGLFGSVTPSGATAAAPAIEPPASASATSVVARTDVAAVAASDAQSPPAPGTPVRGGEPTSTAATAPDPVSGRTPTSTGPRRTIRGAHRGATVRSETSTPVPVRATPPTTVSVMRAAARSSASEASPAAPTEPASPVTGPGAPVIAAGSAPVAVPSKATPRATAGEHETGTGAGTAGPSIGPDQRPTVPTRAPIPDVRAAVVLKPDRRPAPSGDATPAPSLASGRLDDVRGEATLASAAAAPGSTAEPAPSGKRASSVAIDDVAPGEAAPARAVVAGATMDGAAAAVARGEAAPAGPPPEPDRVTPVARPEQPLASAPAHGGRADRERAGIRAVDAPLGAAVSLDGPAALGASAPRVDGASSTGDSAVAAGGVRLESIRQEPASPAMPDAGGGKAPTPMPDQGPARATRSDGLAIDPHPGAAPDPSMPQVVQATPPATPAGSEALATASSSRDAAAAQPIAGDPGDHADRLAARDAIDSTRTAATPGRFGLPVAAERSAGSDPGRDAHEERRRGSKDDRVDGAPGVQSAPARASSDVTQGRAPDAPAAPRSVMAQVIERLGALRREGQHQISLQLEPSELGTVHVDAVLRGREMTVQIRTELGHARDLLAQSVPQLRETLAQQGIVPTRVTVELGLGASSRDASGRGFSAFRPPSSPGMPAAPGGDARGAKQGPTAALGAFDVWV